MSKNFTFYLAVLLLFGSGIYAVLSFGSQLQPAVTQSVTHPVGPQVKTPWEGFAQTFGENVKSPLSLLLVQIILIVAIAKLMGALCLKIRQPPVIGEMFAGILLGPSLLGMVAPRAQEFLFPISSMGALQMLSQIGVILFMFIVGIELDGKHLRQHAPAAVLVSHASILVPFFLGSVCALLLYRSLAPTGIPFNAFALFLGVVMSITAFPVLARIIEERGMSGSSLGGTAIACAAVDDITAWCLLAGVVAVVRSNGMGSSLVTILLSLLFIVTMLVVVRRWMGGLVGGASTCKNRNGRLLAGILLFVFAAALFTELIGIHALFGAFLAGVSMSREPGLRQFLRERLETFSSVLLLPIFFAFTGLRTQIGLLEDLESWLTCVGIIAAAIAGKLGGSMLAARWTGMGWGESFALGALMNTRGLVELIVLNLGYDLGILSPRLFAMLVLMALVTTFMTVPLLQLSTLWGRRESLAIALKNQISTRP